MDSLLLVSRQAAMARPDICQAALDVLGSDGAADVRLTSDAAEIDTALQQREDRRLVLAGGDGDVRLLVERLYRRGESADVPIGLVPLGPDDNLARHLGLPPDPASATWLTLAGRPRRLDLLRSDWGGGPVVNAVLVGDGLRPGAVGAVGSRLGRGGRRLHVNVDDEVLADGEHRVRTVAIGNGSSAGGSVVFPDADAGDGALDVLLVRAGWRGARRARGRAVTITPAPGVSAEVDADGQLSTLDRGRSWWIEPAAWSVLCRPRVAGAAGTPREA